MFIDLALPVVEGLFEGYNATIFAYGQTGSGKTHTMMGTDAEPGVTPRVAAAIFEMADARCGADDGSTSIEIFVSYMQVYKESIQDLLGTDPTAQLNAVSYTHLTLPTILLV